jgi:hypothetical protein
VSNLSILLQFFFFLLITTTSYSQKAIITEIRDINPSNKEKYVFPLVTIPSNNTSTKKINKIMQEEVLYLDSTGYKKSIFEVAWDRENVNSPGWTYYNFEYKVLSNTDHYVCLRISFVGGKHAQQSTLYYLFDNTSGENVQFVNILNSEGQKWLISEMVNTQKKRIQKLLPSLEDSLKLPPNPLYQYDSLSKEDINKEIQMYKSCLESKLATYLSDSDSIEYIALYIKEEMLIAEGIACADSWNSQRLDELGDCLYSIPLKRISQFLTPYGKKLLLSMSK